MKFINYLEKISNISIYGLASLFIFFTFFCVMLVWVLRSDKDEMNKISRIPLD